MTYEELYNAKDGGWYGTKHKGERIGRHECGRILENIEYNGRHEKQKYSVARVLGPGGPSEIVTVYGLDEARCAIRGCWDWEVKNEKGKVVL